MGNQTPHEPLDPDMLEALRRIAEAVRQVHANPEHGDAKPGGVLWEERPEAGKVQEEPRENAWEILRDRGIVPGERWGFRPEPNRPDPRYPLESWLPPSDDFKPYREWTPGRDEEED